MAEEVHYECGQCGFAAQDVNDNNYVTDRLPVLFIFQKELALVRNKKPTVIINYSVWTMAGLLSDTAIYNYKPKTFLTLNHLTFITVQPIHKSK